MTEEPKPLTERPFMLDGREGIKPHAPFQNQNQRSRRPHTKWRTRGPVHPVVVKSLDGTPVGPTEPQEGQE
jgi:hypothetical protein